MAQNVQVDSWVYVPVSRITDAQGAPAALRRLRVVEVRGKQIRVQLDGGHPSDLIGMSLVHIDVGILVLLIGDFDTEYTLLEPLTKSILQFCRLLLPDDNQIRVIRLRSLSELKVFWNRNHRAYSHVVLVGHGRRDAIRFSVSSWQTADKLGDAMSVRDASPKIFLSLCCNTGYRDFAKPFSKSSICKALIAPFQSVHGAVASQYCQTYLTAHFLEGRSVGVAHSQAREAVTGTASFRYWQRGEMK